MLFVAALYSFFVTGEYAFEWSHDHALIQLTNGRELRLFPVLDYCKYDAINYRDNDFLILRNITFPHFPVHLVFLISLSKELCLLWDHRNILQKVLIV